LVAVRDRALGRRCQAGHGERAAGQPAECQGTVRAAIEGPAGGVWRSYAGAACPKKAAGPVGRGREVILRIQQGLAADGFVVPLAKLCQWFGVPRRTVYYKPVKSPKVDPKL